MTKKTMGIHHITAIVGDPQENVDFYTGVLALRLVKKTVNFGDKERYHLYFGNEEGKPGTIITFFAWPGVERGIIGDGQVGVTSYAIPLGALQFWEERLAKFNIAFTKVKRFGEVYLQFEDTHGLRLEIVERQEGEKNKWEFGGVTPDVAIKGFSGASLFSSQPEKTADVLESIMGLERVAQEGDYIRFEATGDMGNTIDLKLTTSGQAVEGPGTVHHIAWRAQDDEDQLDWKQYVESKGHSVSPVRDRNYFNAIYFREYGDILFEIATDPPGFAHDESLETMGEKIMLPPQFERERERLEAILIPVEVKEIK